MSQEIVEAFKRALDAGIRGDFEALLKEMDPQLEWPDRHVSIIEVPDLRDLEMELG